MKFVAYSLLTIKIITFTPGRNHLETDCQKGDFFLIKLRIPLNNFLEKRPDINQIYINLQYKHQPICLYVCSHIFETPLLPISLVYNAKHSSKPNCGTLSKIFKIRLTAFTSFVIMFCFLSVTGKEGGFVAPPPSDLSLI